MLQQSKEEVEPEEVLGRITAAYARLVQGTRQVLAPCPGGRVRGGVGASAGWAWRCGCRGRLSPGHWQSRRMDFTLRAATIGDGDQGGDGAVQCGEVTVQAGDVVGGRRLAPSHRRARR